MARKISKSGHNLREKMIFTITVFDENAKDVGYLFHKNPDKVHSKKVPFGDAHIFYSDISSKSCSLNLLLDINPLTLIRGKNGESKNAYPLEQYVNDRPYVCNSFMSVAISKILGTALNGACKKKPELIEKKWKIELTIPVIRVRGGEVFLNKLFEPLNYKIKSEKIILDDQIESWGDSTYFNVTLMGEHRIKDILSHLYILFPVMDGDKHYWVDQDEVEKLLLKGKSWLKSHPIKEEISKRYFKKLKSLSNNALLNLNLDDLEQNTICTQNNIVQEQRKPLNQLRIDFVMNLLKKNNVSSLLDLGCGEGYLIKELIKDRSFLINLTKILGIDISSRDLLRAKEKLNLTQLSEAIQEKISFEIGSVLYRDKRFNKFDAITLIEVIEHIEMNRLIHFERVVFEYASAKLIIITTPNVEYNTKFKNLEEDKLRHHDHRFEWTRKEFSIWAKKIANKYGYKLELLSVGEADLEFGTPTQVGVFTK